MLAASSPPPPRPGLTFKSGGWVLALAGVMTVMIVLLQVVPVLQRSGSHAVGDGQRPETYGFDLSGLMRMKGQVVGSGMPRDGLPVLDDPRVITAGEADDINRRERGKYLVPHDRVIGVTWGSFSRAYPLRVLNWHEVVNDTLGHEPVAVTYNPLCDAAVVYSRRAGPEVLSFGFSGLLLNSNSLMYDRRPHHRGESLWSQLLGRAVSGPAAGTMLPVLPCAVVSWETWRDQHPDTTVLAPDPAFRSRYKREPYQVYFAGEALRFPVAPLPPPSGPSLKTRVLILEAGNQRQVLSFPDIARRAASGPFRIDVGPLPVEVSFTAEPETAWARSLDTANPLAIRQGFWFAWFSLNNLD